MPAERWRVFLDTNVLISGLASQAGARGSAATRLSAETGASAATLDLGEAEEILVALSRQVLVEADRVFAAKFPHLMERCRRYIKNLAPLLADGPPRKEVEKAKRIIEPDDAAILAAAKREKVDYLVTLNTRRFHAAKARAYLPCPIVTPSVFLFVFRKAWE